MTSSASAGHSPPPPQRREQVVAAALVGAVVILLGYASGLGVEPGRSSASTSVPTVGSTATPPHLPIAAGAVPAPTTRRPVNYIGVGVPVPGAGALPAASSPVVARTIVKVGAGAAPRPQVEHFFGTASVAASSQSVSCPTDWLSSLLSSITSASSPSAAGLPLIGGLLNMLTGGLGLGLPTPPLLGEVTQLLAAVPSLPGVGSTSGTSAPSAGLAAGSNNAALASACTTALSKILPIGGG